LRAPLNAFTEFAGETHGRDLAQDSHGNEIVEEVHVPQDRRVPFRVSDDRRDALHLEGKDLFFNARRDGLGRQFQEEIPPRIVDGPHCTCFDFFCHARGQVNVGTHADPQIQTSCAQ